MHTTSEGFYLELKVIKFEETLRSTFRLNLQIYLNGEFSLAKVWSDLKVENGVSINGKQETISTSQTPFVNKQDSACFLMNGDNRHLLSPVSCDIQASYICVQSSTITDQPELLSFILFDQPFNSGCPEGFEPLTDQTCIELRSEQLVWNDAEAKCAEDGAYLFLPRSARDQTLFDRFLKTRGSTYDFHIGVHKPERQWIYSKSGTPAVTQCEIKDTISKV